MPTVVAVDWSGARARAEQQRRIWTATVRDGVVDLLSGRTRQQVVDWLVDLGRSEPLVVGLDFSFAFPRWFAEANGCPDIDAVWNLAAELGEQWLTGCPPPFWGSKGSRRPRDRELLRRTEAGIPGRAPKSTFQIAGAGAVGTGSIRGMPFLPFLRRAGFAIWPFDDPVPPVALEIYPRALYPARLVKTNAMQCAEHLQARWPALDAETRRVASATDDAFDALVAALVLAEHADQLLRSAVAPDEDTSLEGQIWMPPAG